MGTTTFKKMVAYKKPFISFLILSLLLLSATGTIAVKDVSAVGPTTVLLGNATSFSVLSGSGISNTGATVVYGDVGLSPTTGAAITGFPPGTVEGTIYAVDLFGPAGSVNDPGLLTLAKNDLTTAYNDAAGRTPATTVGTELGGTTLTPGVYDSASGTFGITETLTLDGQGDPNAVFIFQTESTLITASYSVVYLINSAHVCNVFWQVGSSATIGTYSDVVGNILAFTSITLNTGATVDGRVLALNGAVTLDTNIIGQTVHLEAIVLAPESSTNPVGDSHTVTARVAGTGDPVADRTVNFRVISGPNEDLTGSSVTDSNGEATFSYISSSEGTDTIVASFENSQEEKVISNQVTKTWAPSFVIPESPLGVLGVILAAGGGLVAFNVMKIKRARNEKR